MNNNGVLKRDAKTRKVEQFATDLSYLEALLMVVKMREHSDGNYYWIGSLQKK